MCKLRDVKEKLKEWNKNEFGNLNTKLESLKEKLHQLDLLAEERALTTDEKKEKEDCRNEFWSTEKLRECLWRQKSRAKWIKLGDRNTRYFQIITNNRYRKNFLGSVEVGGVQIEEPFQIKEAAVAYFKGIFTKQIEGLSILGGVFSRRIQDHDSRDLEIPFTVEEIVMVVKDCYKVLEG